MKKILFVTSNLGVGGAQQHLILFANFLLDKGYQILVLNTNTNNEFAYRFKEGVEVINIPRKYNFDINPAFEIYKIANQRQIHHIFCDSLFSYIYAYKLALENDNKVSVIFHTTNYVDNWNYLKDLFVRIFLNRRVRLIGVSANQIKRLSKVLFISSKRFKLIYNGIDKEYFNFNIREELRVLNLRRQLEIPQDAFVIVKTARLYAEKNHELAIKALRILRDDYKLNAYMIFVGNSDGNRKQVIEKLIFENNLNDYIKLVGAKKDVRPYLAVSDMFILSSKSVETFSIAALEAMAMGLPAVLTNLGGANEMIMEGQNGYVATFENKNEYAKAIARVIKGENKLSNKEISAYVIEKFELNMTNENLEAFVMGN
ncbi:glycosyltransferase involved in cell wall biosynthesis [Arcicella rosea]|uniref:glycosyltransferase family 4 protein n=1 Tax=Arcicella rosea TaxID=502909 RepID=UPI00345CFD5F